MINKLHPDGVFSVGKKFARQKPLAQQHPMNISGDFSLSNAENTTGETQNPVYPYQ